MTALVLAALAVGLGNFAAAVGIGLSGVDSRTRLRVAAVFGIFESAMPLVGLVLGRNIADVLGSTTRYIGGALLVTAGVWTLWQTKRAATAADDAEIVSTQNLGRLTVTALALSVDNLVVGFGLGVAQTRFGVAVAVFAVVSIVLSLAGLELGRHLGARIESNSEVLAGLVLIAVGALVAAGVI